MIIATLGRFLKGLEGNVDIFTNVKFSIHPDRLYDAGLQA